jgi:uncharacterized membrane protein YeiH
MTLLPFLDYASVFVFALTGALVASRAQLDLVGFLFIAALTALGGGTIRDLLLDRNPIFWMADPTLLAVTAIAAGLVFLTAHLFESRLRVLTWLDAIALAIAVPAGVGLALDMGQHWGVVLIMGIATGTFGGLMRDVVCNEVPLVLKQGELYLTAAFAGAAAALGAKAIGLDQSIALISCAAVTFALRAGSLSFGWRLPVYRSRPPRS